MDVEQEPEMFVEATEKESTENEFVDISIVSPQFQEQAQETIVLRRQYRLVRK
jgi:hypothetical protein